MERVPAYARKWEGGDDTDRATARRTFERDKRELREMGIPIETVSYTVNFGGERKEGYRLAEEDFYLPYLRLVSGAAGLASEAGDGPPPGAPAVEIEAGEAAVAVDALRRAADLPAFPLAAEARSALRKLTFDVDAGRLSHTPVFHPDRPGAAETARRVRLLVDALLERHRLRFRYRGIRRGRLTDRDVAPYGLFFQHGEWYLVGSDAARDGDTRVFRADRMEGVEPGGGSGGYDVPDGFEVVDYLDRDAWELDGGETTEDEAVDARVLFRFPASLRVERHGRGEAVEALDDGAAVRRFRVRQVGPFLRWILTFRGDAEVLSPPSLRKELADMAREVAALYRVGEDGRAPGDPGGAGDDGRDAGAGGDG
jgi:predicted DNA-binding transcriptional regulator YafY